jgi:hypothetical protein
VRDIFAQSKTNNLRLLKQALWDCEFFSSVFDDKHWGNPEFIECIFKVILSLSFEVKSGRLKKSEDPWMVRNRITRTLSKTSPNIFDGIEEKYIGVEFWQKYLSYNLLKDFLYTMVNWIRRQL